MTFSANDFSQGSYFRVIRRKRARVYLHSAHWNLSNHIFACFCDHWVVCKFSSVLLAIVYYVHTVYKHRQKDAVVLTNDRFAVYFRSYCAVTNTWLIQEEWFRVLLSYRSWLWPCCYSLMHQQQRGSTFTNTQDTQENFLQVSGRELIGRTT